MELFAFSLPPTVLQDGKGVLVDLDENDVLSEVVARLYTVERRLFVGCNLLIVRPPVGIQRDADLRPDEIEDYGILADRFPEVPIRLLCSRKYILTLGPNVAPAATGGFGSTDHTAQILSSLQQQEMKDFVAKSRALLPKSPGFRYRLPSGAYSNAFLRVGNIQVSTHILDSIFFWLLPHLKDAHGIVVETWSIGSVALNVCRLIARYDPTKQAFRMAMLAHYFDDGPGSFSELSAVADSVSGGFKKPFVVLFSTALSGQSIARLNRSLAVLRCPKNLARFVFLYRLSATEIVAEGEVLPELCDFSVEMLNAQKSDDDVADKGVTPVIEIDTQTYFPRVVQEAELPVTINYATANKEFFDRYREIPAIRVHSDAYIGKQIYRHHGIAIDVEKIIEVPAFQTRLRTKIAGLSPKPRLLLTPPHSAGRALGRLIQRGFCSTDNDIEPELYCTLDFSDASLFGDGGLESLHQEAALLGVLESLDTDASIVVFDDVVTSGQRIRTFQRRLRDIKYRGRIHYVVAVARMQSGEQWESFCKMLRVNTGGKPHTITPIEKVVLPDWDDRSCPWCQERKIFDDIIQSNKDGVSDAMARRATMLRSAGPRGLCEDVFLEGDAKPMELTPNSIFVGVPSTPATIVAAVASAIQEMRTDISPAKRLVPDGFPLRSVLPLADFEKFTDPILRAALMRVVLPTELRRSMEGLEDERALWARKKLQSLDPADRQLRRELLVAILMRKFPPQTLDAETLEFLREDGFKEFCDLVIQGRL